MKSRIQKWPLVILFLSISGLSLAGLLVDLSQNRSSTEYFWEETIWNLQGLIFLGIAAIILLKNQKNLIGWGLLTPAIAVALAGIGSLFYGSLAEMPEVLTMGQALFVWFSGASWVLLIAPIFLISLIYPDGKLPGKIQRIGLWMLGITFGLFLFFATFSDLLENIENEGQFWANPFGFIPIEFGEIFFAIFSVLLLLTTILCLIAIVSRYRNSAGVERAQMKWLFYSMSIFLIFYLITAIAQNTDQDFGIFWNIAFVSTIAFIPVSIGIAIMRYRLWDIDLLINRSLIYGLLTAVVAAIWAGSLTVIDQVITNLVGDDSKAASTVLSTLLAASIIQPARTKIEAWINKRFFPEKGQLEEGFIEIEPRFWPHLDTKQMAESTIERVCEIMRAPKGTFMLRKKKKGFAPIAGHGIKMKDIPTFNPDRKKIDDLQNGRAISIKDNGNFNLFVPLFIPRVGSNEVLGLMGISLRKLGRGYSGDEIKELTKLGRKLGEALHNLEMKEMK